MARRGSSRSRGFQPGTICSSTAFTLIELILVMALLVILLAMLAPLLSNSLRGHGLTEEATRFVALTEYARSEAVSLGIPTTVWAEPASARYGLEVKAGYEALAQGGRPRSFQAAPEVRLELTNATASTAGRTVAAEYTPAGVLSTGSAETVRFLDRHGSAATVVRMQDGWGYELARATR